MREKFATRYSRNLPKIKTAYLGISFTKFKFLQYNTWILQYNIYKIRLWRAQFYRKDSLTDSTRIYICRSTQFIILLVLSVSQDIDHLQRPCWCFRHWRILDKEECGLYRLTPFVRHSSSVSFEYHLIYKSIIIINISNPLR